MLTQLPALKTIVEAYHLAPSKSLGQNFLFDLNITDKIVRLAGRLEGKTVVEVGPGPGGLTRSLLATNAGKVIAIEKDATCAAALIDYLAPHSQGRLEVIHADALSFDWHQFTQPITIIANLPYNISTHLLTHWLDNITQIEGMTLMFQREVAMRINAKPRCKDYGRLSVKSQWLCDVEHGFDIVPEAFYPPPKVTSSVIRLTPYPKPRYKADAKTLDMVLKTTFGQRRKTLRSSLKGRCADPLVLFKQLGLSPMARPEELTIEQFCQLSSLFTTNNC